MYNYWVYDLETYPNCFTCCIADMQERVMKVFEISDRKDQREQMFEYLRNVRRSNGYMVGFNNVGFDYPVLHEMLTNKKMSVADIYNFAMRVIRSGNSDNRWQYIVREKDMLLKQIDLFKIHHYDNKAKATSLKMIEFNGRSKNIEDLPFPVGKKLSDVEKDILIKYNRHDVMETIKFFGASMDQVAFRHKMVTDYNMPAMNYNDTKIGAEYFVMELEKAGIRCYENGKVRQTQRPFIDLVDCIFPYIKFERPEFNAVLDWLKRQRISQTKGVFSDIMEHELGDVAKYALLTTKREKLKNKPTDAEVEQFRKEKPLCWVEEVQLKAKLPKKDGGGFKKSYYLCWNIAESLNVVVEGLCYVFGTGGAHAAVEKRMVVSDTKRVIRTFDVSSYYPNLSIKNKLYPEHLGVEFCDVYDFLYNLRKSYDKKSAENAMLKLALNGTYGKSNDQYSPFYDPKFTMSITLNGQMLLCKAIEMVLSVPTVEILMANTDGFEFMVDREYNDLAEQKCREWEELTNLTLEGDTYAKMIIADVNNYFAVYEGSDGKSN